MTEPQDSGGEEMTAETRTARERQKVRHFLMNRGISEDAVSLLDAVLDFAAAERERADRLQDEVIELGKECAVWITGDPDDQQAVAAFSVAMDAIRAALKLGQERNDEANNLRQQVEALRAALTNIEERSQSSIGEDAVDDPENAIMEIWEIAHQALAVSPQQGTVSKSFDESDIETRFE